MKIKTCPILAAVLIVSAQSALGAESANESLQKGLLEEEGNHNLDAAVQSYQSAIQGFDEQRKAVAQAVFRLGECYRKLGKTNEAVIEYQRVIQDFADQTSVVGPSRAMLATLRPENGSDQNDPGAKNTPAVTDSEQLKLLSEEIGLVEKEIAASEAKFKNGQGDLTDIVKSKKELLSLQRQLPENAPAAAQKRLVDEQVQLVNQLLAEMKKRIEVGAAPPLDTVPLERELLGLKRELIAIAKPQADGRALPNTESATLADDETREIERFKEIIRSSPDLINAAAPLGVPPLASAAANGQLRVVRFLLENKADINARSESGTPLHLATFNGHRAMVELLLANGADVKARDSSGATPLHRAAERGFVAVTQALLMARPDLNARSSEGRTPLNIAADHGYKAVAELLLDAGADVNLADKEGGTPLFWAVYRSDLPLTKLLVEKGANPNVKSRKITPLVWAIEQDDSEMVTLLLAHGANPNAASELVGLRNGTSAFGSSVVVPLVAALAKDRTNLADILLQNKADPNARDEQGRTPLLSVVQARKDQMIGFLVTKGVDVNATDDGGYSPLLVAVRQNDMSMVKLLLKLGVNANLKSKDGDFALLYAVRPEPDLAEILLSNKANPNLKGVKGYTALHSAAANGSVEVVKLLLDHGANVNARDDAGNTPLHYAAYQGRKAVVELLLNNQADVNIQNESSRTALALAGLPNAFKGIDAWAVPSNDIRGGGFRFVTAPPVAPPTRDSAARDIANLLRQHGAKE